MGKVQCNHKYPYKREAGGLEEDATLIALKTEEGAMNQGMNTETSRG